MLTLREVFPVNLAMHELEQKSADEELRYLIERRDQTNDKIRFGVLTLNGGSLLALIGALGGEGKAAIWLGFTPKISLISACCFVTGLILTGFAINVQLNQSTKESGDAVSRSITLRRLVSLYDQQATPENHNRLEETMNGLHKLPLTGFQFSETASIAQHTTSSAWLAGILIPLANVIETIWSKAPC
jgi:hypothetical protein